MKGILIKIKNKLNAYISNKYVKTINAIIATSVCLFIAFISFNTCTHNMQNAEYIKLKTYLDNNYVVSKKESDNNLIKLKEIVDNAKTADSLINKEETTKTKYFLKLTYKYRLKRNNCDIFIKSNIKDYSDFEVDDINMWIEVPRSTYYSFRKGLLISISNTPLASGMLYVTDMQITPTKSRKIQHL